MAKKEWQAVKTIYCNRIGAQVALESETIHPADTLPDMQARITGHRCSHAELCNLDGRGSCVWAGTNPVYDPFKE